MARIVDRRYDSRNKSAVNRQRFFKRFRGQIRKAVADAVAGRGIRDLDKGESVTIPAKDLNEPNFSLDRRGVWETIFPGNDQFVSGDEIPRPIGGEGSSGRGSASDSGESEDDFVFQLSREEFLNFFFEDLELPNLVRTQLARLKEFKSMRAGHTPMGVPANINIVRSLRGAAGRRMALSAPRTAALRAAEQRLEELRRRLGDCDPEVLALMTEVERLRKRLEKVPFIDSYDLRFNNRILREQPTSQAVMFCIMDVSGSMDEERKQIAKRFFMLLYLFLIRNYDHIELVFIRHHTVAKEVDEQDFFHSRESGGTVVSSALRLAEEIIKDRYSSDLWNIYCAQASDGDNWENDSPVCGELLTTAILPYVQYFAYIEITQGQPQNLWREYAKTMPYWPDRFAMQRIETLADIYPVFRELFRKKTA